VAAFNTGASRPLYGRGGSPGFRFTLYAILSIVVMFLDERGEWLEQARYILQAAAYPVQLAVSSPSAAWQWIKESVETREALRAENERLRTRQRELELRSMRYEALLRENDQLRGLKEALPGLAERWLVAEVVNIQLNSLRQRVLINRGTSNGVFKGQAVLDDNGLLGQTIHVGPWSAEVILITDPEHAVPVQIERTGLRTIAVGAGDTATLALPYLPANADVKAGDLLLTSGLGGVFPAGYPVARVSEVHRDAVQPLAQVRARPVARIDVDREVALVWFREGDPSAPVAAGDAGKGNAAMQPQAVTRAVLPSTAPGPGSGTQSAPAGAAKPTGGTAPAQPVPAAAVAAKPNSHASTTVATAKPTNSPEPTTPVTAKPTSRPAPALAPPAVPAAENPAKEPAVPVPEAE
jgi:rod shape-determining protein MreC